MTGIFLSYPLRGDVMVLGCEYNKLLEGGGGYPTTVFEKKLPLFILQKL